MSRTADEFLTLARQANEKARGRSDELRGVLQAVSDTYTLLARVQAVLDDQGAVYISQANYAEAKLLDMAAGPGRVGGQS